MIKEDDIDIVELIINNMPVETSTQSMIKMYMQMNKSLCNEFVYTKYRKDVLAFNELLKRFMADLGSEVTRVLVKENLI